MLVFISTITYLYALFLDRKYTRINTIYGYTHFTLTVVYLSQQYLG